MKQCCTCKQLKPFVEFYIDRRNQDGHRSQCRACMAQRWQRYYQAKLRTPKQRRYYRQKAHAWYIQNKVVVLRRLATEAQTIKGKARKLVRNRVQNGTLKKARRCEMCHRQTRLDGHHDDYSKPLVVRWLCALHHKEHHMLQKRLSP